MEIIRKAISEQAYKRTHKKVALPAPHCPASPELSDDSCFRPRPCSWTAEVSVACSHGGLYGSQFCDGLSTRDSCGENSLMQLGTALTFGGSSRVMSRLRDTTILPSPCMPADGLQGPGGFVCDGWQPYAARSAEDRVQTPGSAVLEGARRRSRDVPTPKKR